MMMPELTASETRITEILLRKDGDAAAPLKAIAEEAETSEAMVVKTAKRLGSSGYKELRAALQAYRTQPHVDLHQELKPDDTAATIIHKVFRTSIQALEETLSIFDIEAFRRAAELIHEARQRDFYGLGGSAELARDASHKFLRIGIRTIPAGRRAFWSRFRSHGPTGRASSPSRTIARRLWRSCATSWCARPPRARI
jgi:RpiR family transcriptional regulator, repressor of rpiB and als operon